MPRNHVSKCHIPTVHIGDPWSYSVSHQGRTVHTFICRLEDQDGLERIQIILWIAQPGIFYMGCPTSRTLLALSRNKTHGKQKVALAKVSLEACSENHSPPPVLEAGRRGRMGTLLRWLNLLTNPYVTLLEKEGRKKKTSICNRMKSGKTGPKTLRNSKQLWEFWAHKP